MSQPLFLSSVTLDQPLCLSVPMYKMMELEWVPHGVLFHLPMPERWDETGMSNCPYGVLSKRSRNSVLPLNVHHTYGQLSSLDRLETHSSASLRSASEAFLRKSWFPAVTGVMPSILKACQVSSCLPCAPWRSLCWQPGEETAPLLPTQSRVGEGEQCLLCRPSHLGLAPLLSHHAACHLSKGC